MSSKNHNYLNAAVSDSEPKKLSIAGKECFASNYMNLQNPEHTCKAEGYSHISSYLFIVLIFFQCINCMTAELIIGKAYVTSFDVGKIMF